MNGVITYSDVQEAKCKEFAIRQDQEDNFTVRDELEKILESIRKIHDIGANTTHQPLTEISDEMAGEVERKVLVFLAKTVEIEDFAARQSRRHTRKRFISRPSSTRARKHSNVRSICA